MEMCSVSEVSGQCVSLVWEYLQLAAVQRPPAREGDELHERDKLIQSRALFLPVAGRTWQSPERSSHTVQHIENIHSQQDKIEKDQSFLPHFLREGWHHSPVARSPVPQTHLVPPAEGGGYIHVQKS